LTNIRGYLEALNDRVLPFSTETFTLLQSETQRLADLVEDVLQLARADAAPGRLELAPADLAEIIRNTLPPFAPALEEKSVRVHLDLPDAPVVVAADRRRLSRVMRNLTDNAIRYAPPGGRVDIRLAPDPDRVRIDYGNRADRLVADDLPYLFERFYRGEKSRSRQHGGAGIGLAIVKELVEAHGGTVSAALEEGRFHIRLTLPVSPPDQSTGL
jgi:signal transduction histidine kinase